MITVNAVNAYKDNYIWIIVNQKNKACAIVDPGEAGPVLTYLKKNQLNPAAILITHHHWDHTSGIEKLLNHYSLRVYGPSKENIPLITHQLKDNDYFELTELSIKFQTLELPGHTIGQLAYYGDQKVFTGDTLFSAGCGRMFEGTPEQFIHSLERLRSLPNDTEVYCGHEYTIKNLEFAAKLEPKNSFILKHLKKCKKLIKESVATLPSTIALEKEINPFFRWDQPTIIQAAENYAKQKLISPAEIFAIIRKMKDNF